MRKTKWLAAALGVSAWMVAVPSWADDPATAGALQIGVGFRYGVGLNDGDFNPWGTGLGLEVGYTLPLLHVYVGGNAEYFFGTTKQALDVKVDGNIWQVTAEGGYDFGFGHHVVLRPKLGLGYANVIGESCIGGADCLKSNDNQAVIAPGAKLILIASHFELAFDARYDVVLSDPTAKALIFSLGIGF